MQLDHPVREHGRRLAVLFFFLLLGIALTWPLITRIVTDLPGGAHKDGLEDAYQNVWNLWWTLEALRHPTNLWVTDRLFFPDGPNLLFHTLSPANTLPAAPVTALWGPIAAFNVVALASFALGGLGMWLLARPRVGAGPALLAGIVYVASPFHMAALVTDGQLQIFALHWLPWYSFFLLELLRPDATQAWRRHALLSGFLLVLIAWTDWYYTLFMLIFSLAALAWRLPAFWRAGACAEQQAAGVRLKRIGLQLIPRLALAGLVFALGAGPLIGAMLLEAARTNYVASLPPSDPWRLSADLVAYLVPPRLHALWGTAPWAWGVGYDVNRRFYLGLGVALLATLALLRRPAIRPWALAALGFGLLSLGPALRVNGADLGVPLPYALIADLPLVRLTRQPDRFNVLVTMALGMLAGSGAAVLGARLRRPAARVALLALLGVLLLLDYWPAPLVTRTPLPPAFLANLPADAGALVEYPFHVERPYRDAERMLFQTTHGQPISGGYHSREYPQPQLGLPALRDLRAGQLASDIVEGDASWAAALGMLGYTHILGYRQQPLGPQSLKPADELAFRALVEAGLGVAGPLYEDEFLIVYAVPPAAPAPFVQIGRGWGEVEAAAFGQRYRWLPEIAELGLVVPTSGLYRLELAITPAGGPRTLLVEQQDRPFSLALAAGSRHYHLLLRLPAGHTLLRLRTLEAPTTGAALEGNGDLRPLSARFAQISLVLIEGR